MITNNDVDSESFITSLRYVYYMVEYVGTEESGPLGKAKVIGHIEIEVCLFCAHHRDMHGPEGCSYCQCPKKNLRTPQIKPNNKNETIK